MPARDADRSEKERRRGVRGTYPARRRSRRSQPEEPQGPGPQSGEPSVQSTLERRRASASPAPFAARGEGTNKGGVSAGVESGAGRGEGGGDQPWKRPARRARTRARKGASSGREPSVRDDPGGGPRPTEARDAPRERRKGYGWVGRGRPPFWIRTPPARKLPPSLAPAPVVPRPARARLCDPRVESVRSSNPSRDRRLARSRGASKRRAPRKRRAACASQRAPPRGPRFFQRRGRAGDAASRRRCAV